MICNRNLNLEGIAELKDAEGKRIYSDVLIENMKIKKIKYLKNLDITLKKDPFFMTQLLFAVKNSIGTYEVYQHFGVSLQKDTEIASVIVDEQPEVIEGTEVSFDGAMMLKLAQINPKSILYMAEGLKNNGKFIQELCEIEGTAQYAVQICNDNIFEVIQENPNLLLNPEFMVESVKEDPMLMAVVSEEFKNNYKFIKEASMKNREVIDYIADHTEEFGKEGLKAAKEVLTENTSCKAIDEFQTELEKVQEEIEIMESKEGFDKDGKEYKDLLLRKRHAEHGIKFMDRIRNMEDPRRALELIDRLCVGKSEEYKQDLVKYFKLDDAVIAKEKEEKNKNNNYTSKDIEMVAGDKKLSDIQKEPDAVRVQMEEQTKESHENEQETDKMEIGE